MMVERKNNDFHRDTNLLSEIFFFLISESLLNNLETFRNFVFNYRKLFYFIRRRGVIFISNYIYIL